jgi:hypothetical protein
VLLKSVSPSPQRKLDAAVLFQAVDQGEVDEIQAAGGLFESHTHLLT